MNQELKHHILKALDAEMRFDGRKLTEFRNIEIETGISKNAEGSARVKMGETEIMAGIKLGIDKPFLDRPEDAILMVGTELLPMASPEFEAGPPDDQSIELSRVVDRGIRESKAIELKKYCIKKGEKVWSISVDIVAINDAGNLLDAAALAAIVALKNTRFPKYENDTINYKELTKETLSIKKIPIAVTVVKIGEKFLVDPSLEEEQVIDAKLTVTSTTDGIICALQKGGFMGLSTQDIDFMLSLGMEKAKELAKLIG